MTSRGATAWFPCTTLVSVALLCVHVCLRGVWLWATRNPIGCFCLRPANLPNRQSVEPWFRFNFYIINDSVESWVSCFFSACDSSTSSPSPPRLLLTPFGPEFCCCWLKANFAKLITLSWLRQTSKRMTNVKDVALDVY